jgi:hypothetical protein
MYRIAMQTGDLETWKLRCVQRRTPPSAPLGGSPARVNFLRKQPQKHLDQIFAREVGRKFLCCR